MRRRLPWLIAPKLDAGTVGGQALAIRGSLDYQPPPQSSFNPILIAPLVALALAGGIFWWARRRRSMPR